MRSRSWTRRGLVAVAASVVAASLALQDEGAGSAARPDAGRVGPRDLCVMVDPVVDLGCRDLPVQTGAGSSGPPEPPNAQISPTEPVEQSVVVRRTSTVPRYDPRRLAVKFRRGASTQEIRAVVARAGATIVERVPHIDAYLLGVEPQRR